MIKGVPALRPTRARGVDLGFSGESQNLKRTMQKWETKNGGTEPENQGPEPQSARAGEIETHFHIFWKSFKNNRGRIHFSFLVRSFFVFFSRFFGKAEKEVQGPTPGP